jgi:ATP-dependent helicase Lhr and Lhr-like helicase
VTSSKTKSKQLGLRALEKWFDDKGWKPFAFQKKCWLTYQRQTHFLLHSSTGSGKTLAAWMGPVAEFLNQPTNESLWNHRRGHRPSPPLTVLWITPLRALSADTQTALRQPIEDFGLPWSIESRTGDSSSSLKARHRKFLPTGLITTPESLSLMLSHPESLQQFRTLKCVVVDEWHELMGTKRGIQTELALARLRTIAPDAVRCGLSATLGNLDEALACLVGQSNLESGKVTLIRGDSTRKMQVSTIVPKTIERFPWAGHLGLPMAPRVIEVIEQGGSSLVFTNTRNQAENWFRALLTLKPDWAGELALHHGSLDRETRRWVEAAMREGRLKAVVCRAAWI